MLLPSPAHPHAASRPAPHLPQGDSGGPVIKPGLTAAQDVSIGITSWGRGCAADTPGVYSDVAAAVPWIRQAMDVSR